MTLFNYWWLSIKGNAPEDVTSLVIVGVVSAIFVPKVRAWWKRREQLLHAKVDHLLKVNAHLVKHHPQINNVSHDGVDLSEVPNFEEKP